MKKNKTKENILSVITLLGIFGLFAYFQFSENPVKTSSNKTPRGTMDVSDYAQEKDEKYDFEVVEIKGEETPSTITLSLKNESETSNEISLNTETNKIKPSESQLKKAKMYIDRTWASDDNCKQEWIDYLRNNPDSLNIHIETNNPTANDDKKQVELSKVSSNE